MKQIGLAAQNHHSAQKFFPTGGWGYHYVGDPNRGFDKRQPGGWIFNLLPFLEEKSIHDMGKGLSYGGNKTGALSKALGQMMGMTCRTIMCPSRREDQGLYPMAYAGETTQWYNVDQSCMPPGSPYPLVARSDYCINAGDGSVYQNGTNVSSPTGVTDMDTYAFPNPNPCDDPTNTGAYCTGISYYRSTVPIRKVTDGLTFTYLVGEKFLYTDMYQSGLDGADNEFAYTGWDNDLYRTAGVNYGSSPTINTAPTTDWSPLHDQNSYGNVNTVTNEADRWGSAHPGTFNMVFCDGSVHTITYSIDLLIHRRYSNRMDGQAINAPD